MHLARRFVNEIQQSSLAARTKSQKLVLIKTLIKSGIQYGLVSENPFVNMQLKAPKGTTHNTYRSFTRDELRKIYQLVHSKGDIERCWVLDALICTGSRQGEITYLRKEDIKRTHKGTWFVDFKHQPLHQHPMTLKGGVAGERRMPWHPLLLQEKYQDYVQQKADGYIVRCSKDSSVWSVWFRDQILKRLGIYSKGDTGLHSLRNTAIDLWREAGIDQEHRRAFVAHASKDVQDKVYGEGLRNMADVMNKELLKLDLSWLL